MLTPQEIKYQRMSVWVDNILINIKDIEDALFNNGEIDFTRAREELTEQYRLIKLLKFVVEGKTKLDGWK